MSFAAFIGIFSKQDATFFRVTPFNSNAISQADYDMADIVQELNVEGVKIARELCDEFTAADLSKPRFVAGSHWAPTNRTLSLSPDVEDPGYRAVDFDRLVAVYLEQTRALAEGRL